MYDVQGLQLELAREIRRNESIPSGLETQVLIFLFGYSCFSHSLNNSLVFRIFTECATITTCKCRAFSSSQEETQYPLKNPPSVPCSH
jgi:hypothetical protein